jgi:hypothetical protein
MRNPMTVSNGDEVDSYPVGDEILLTIEQRRHLSNQGKMRTRAFLTVTETRQLASELIAQADQIEGIAPTPTGCDRLPRILEIVDMILKEKEGRYVVYDAVSIPVGLLNMLYNQTDDLIKEMKK